MDKNARAVTPVIGIVLLVAIVVVLAAVVGTFALTTFDAETTPEPAAVFEYEYDDPTLTVRMVSGDRFESANVAFEQADGDAVDVSPPTPDWPAEVRASDVEDVGNVESDDTVRIVWSEPRENGKTAVIGRWSGPDA